MPRLPARRQERSPARWDPFRELEEMHERMGRLLERSLGDVGGLAISGERKERERRGLLRRRTRRTGRFDYRVTLPGEFDADAIDASLEHRVLIVSIPKPQRAQPRRIEIKGG